MNKAYIGDGVYAEMLEDFSCVLTAEDGISTSDRIVLEPEVLDALNRYIQAWFREHTAQRNQNETRS